MFIPTHWKTINYQKSTLTDTNILVWL